MFNATEILIDAFVNEIRDGYRRTYGCFKNDYQDIIAWAGNMALENILYGTVVRLYRLIPILDLVWALLVLARAFNSEHQARRLVPLLWDNS